MLNENIIKEKCTKYYEMNLKQYNNGDDDIAVQSNLAQFINSLYNRIITNDSSDFSEKESKFMEDYNIDVDSLLEYFKDDIKNALKA